MGTVYVPPPNTIFDEGGNEALKITGGTTATPVSTVTVLGNLDVQGALTTIQTTTTQIDDKNIELAVVDNPTDSTADGGGITLKGATDKTIAWYNSTDAWHFNRGVNLTSGKLAVGTQTPTQSLHVATSNDQEGILAKNTSTGAAFFGNRPSLRAALRRPRPARSDFCCLSPLP